MSTLVQYHKKRDLWVKADRVICGGALENVSQLPDASMGAIVTDPPHFTAHKEDAGNEDLWEASSLQAAAAWATPMMEQANRVVRPGGAIAIMCSNYASPAWHLAAEIAGLKWMAELIILWTHSRPRKNNFGSLHTHLLWFTRPGARHTWNSHRKSFYSNVIVAQKVPVNERLHIGQKPIELTNFLVSLLTMPNDIVLDPFCGSGSTLVSADLANRHWIGIDNVKPNVDTARNRVAHPDVEEEKKLYFWSNNKLEEI